MGQVPIYVQLMKNKNGSVPTRINELIDTAFNNWQNLRGNDFISGDLQVRQKMDSINKDIYSSVILPFLENSKDISVYEGTIDENDPHLSLMINTGLHNYLFNSGASFQNLLINGVCKDFALWYIPSSEEAWKRGILINQKYGDEDPDTTMTLPISSFKYTTGSRINGRPPCLAAGVLARIGTASADSQSSSGSDKTIIFYPEEPKRDYGSYFLFQAPAWYSLKPTELQDIVSYSKLVAAEEQEALILGRNPSKVKTAQKKNTEVLKIKKSVLNSALGYLAKKSYYRALLNDSNMEIICPYTGSVNAEVGDMVEINAMLGGSLGKGILSYIRYYVTTDGGGFTTLGLSAVTMPGVTIK